MPPQRSTGNVTASALRGRRSREKTKSKLEALEEENKALKAQNAVLTSKLQRISLCIQCAAIANEALSISNLVVPWSPPSVATVDPDKAAPSDIGGVAPVLEAESLGNEGPVRLGFQPFAASPVAHISETYDMPYALVSSNFSISASATLPLQNLAFDGPESLLSAHTYGACSAYEHGTTVVSTNQSAQTLGSEEMSPVGHFAMPSSALSDSSNLYQAVTPPLNTFPVCNTPGYPNSFDYSPESPSQLIQYAPNDRMYPKIPDIDICEYNTGDNLPSDLDCYLFGPMSSGEVNSSSTVDTSLPNLLSSIGQREGLFNSPESSLSSH